MKVVARLRLPEYLREIEGGTTKYVHRALKLYAPARKVVERLKDLKKQKFIHYESGDYVERCQPFITFAQEFVTRETGMRGWSFIWIVFNKFYLEKLFDNHWSYLGQFEARGDDDFLLSDYPNYSTSIYLSPSQKKDVMDKLDIVVPLSLLCKALREREKPTGSLRDTPDHEQFLQTLLEYAEFCAGEYLDNLIDGDVSAELAALPQSMVPNHFPKLWLSSGVKKVSYKARSRNIAHMVKAHDSHLRRHRERGRK